MSNKKPSHSIAKFKKQRRLGIELPGMGKVGALSKRKYPPGIKGPLARRRFTEFGERLTEKQKLLAHYKMREKSLIRFVKMSKKGLDRNWLGKLFCSLESRLDNLVFRANYAKSIPQARQLVRHGFVSINGKKSTIPSIVVPLGSKITINSSWLDNTEYLKLKDKKNTDLPHFIEKKEGAAEFNFTNLPVSEDIPFELKNRSIAEYFQKV